MNIGRTYTAKNLHIYIYIYLRQISSPFLTFSCTNAFFLWNWALLGQSSIYVCEQCYDNSRLSGFPILFCLFLFFFLLLHVTKYRFSFRNLVTFEEIYQDFFKIGERTDKVRRKVTTSEKKLCNAWPLSLPYRWSCSPAENSDSSPKVDRALSLGVLLFSRRFRCVYLLIVL